MSCAASTLITFDDLPNPAFDVQSTPLPVPNGYAGLQWNNFMYFNPASSILVTQSGYLNGVVSANNVVANNLGNPASISGRTFDLNSAYITGAWRDGLQVEVKGFQGGLLKYDNTYTVNTTGPSLINFDYLGVDEVDFNSWGGVDHGYIGFGEHFAIDSVTISAVPEPSAFALAAFGGALVMSVRRREWSRTVKLVAAPSQPVFAVCPDMNE